MSNCIRNELSERSGDKKNKSKVTPPQNKKIKLFAQIINSRKLKGTRFKGNQNYLTLNSHRNHRYKNCIRNAYAKPNYLKLNYF